MCSVVDAIDFIVRHQDKLTSTERSNLTDPLNVARAVFRRILGRIFAGFEIRKNAEHYSIRCNDPDMYKMLYLYSVMYGRNGAYLDRLDNSLYEQLRNAAAPLSDFFSAFSGRSLSYKFRDENRFFIYVSYMPYSHHYSHEFSNVSTFQTHNLNARLERLRRMYDMIKDIRPTPLVTKFLDFYTRFGQWSLGYLPREMRAGSVTEEFIDYALAAPIGMTLQSIASQYLSTRRAQQEQREEAAREQVRQHQGDMAPSDAQERFRSALARIIHSGRETQAASEPEEPTPLVGTIENTVSPQQDAFNAALARIRAQRNPDERFLEIDLGSYDIEEAQNALRMSAEQVNMESLLEPGLYALLEDSFVNDDEYIRLLQIFSQRRAHSIFRSHDQDVFDDIDTELHGVYFTMEGPDIKYAVYGNGVLLLETKDYNRALALYTERYGQPGEIRYLEELKNEH